MVQHFSAFHYTCSGIYIYIHAVVCNIHVMVYIHVMGLTGYFLQTLNGH